MKQKKQKKNKNNKKMAKKWLTLGNINESRLRLLMLILAIVFLETALLIPKYIVKGEKRDSVKVHVAVTSKNKEMERQITNLVQGYPIEKMTPYIASKDKEVAAFMIAIAKKGECLGKKKTSS